MAKRRAWAIKGPRGNIHLDKICVSKSEAWGLLADELGDGWRPMKNEAMKQKGFTCVRVTIMDDLRPGKSAKREGEQP